jgi:hypothetical protein
MPRMMLDVNYLPKYRDFEALDRLGALNFEQFSIWS